MTYKYSIDDLTETQTGLGTLKGDYEDATRDRESAQGSFGFDDVASAVKEFTSNWSDKRKEQVADIDAASEALKKVIENYEQLDADGVRQVNGEG